MSSYDTSPKAIKDRKDSQALADKLSALGPKKGQEPVRVRVFTLARAIGTTSKRVKDLFWQFKQPIDSFMRDYRLEVGLEGDIFEIKEKVKW